MHTRTPARSQLIIPTLFAILCVALTIVAYTIFGGTVPLAPQGYRVVVPLPDAANLLPNEDVEMAGVTIGKIVTVARAGNRAETTIQLQRRFAPLRAGATAIARTKTLLGEAYLDVAPGPASAPAIPDGGHLAASQVRSEVQLDQFLSTFGPRTRRNLQGLFSGLAQAVTGEAGALNDTLGNAAPLATNYDTVIDALGADSGGLRQVIDQSGAVLGAVSRREGSLRAAVSAGDAVLTATASRNARLAQAMQVLPSFLHELTRASHAITADSPDLGTAVATLEPIAPLLKPSLQAIDTAAPRFRALFGQLSPTLSAGTHSLPALNRILPAAQAGFKQFYPTSRELIPFLQLIAANPGGPAASFANVANVTNGVFVGPEGLVQYYATGLPTVWNETVGGWVKRLPTNRMNPYVEPGGLNDIQKLGYVKSFDCRNTGNPLLLPPTGTGTPPCVLQGPWTFDGKSAFYPRLQGSRRRDRPDAVGGPGMLLTIDASGRVLDLFTVELPEWGVTEVAGELGLSKSKAHALLASLSTVGLLRRTDRGRYRLGWRVAGLNRVLSDTTAFHRHARPVLDVLCARFHETVQLAVLEGERVVYIDRVQRRTGPRSEACPIGPTMPAQCTASGKVLVAGLAIAFDHEEAVPGFCCVAAPVIGEDGETVAAISICAPAARFGARWRVYEVAVKRAGNYVTRQGQPRGVARALAV